MYPIYVFQFNDISSFPPMLFMHGWQTLAALSGLQKVDTLLESFPSCNKSGTQATLF